MTTAHRELLTLTQETPPGFEDFILSGLQILNGLYARIESAEIDLELPSKLLGEHRILPNRPVSTTGTVLFTESGLALKVLSTVEDARFSPRGNPLYPHDNQFANLSTVLGEVAVGQAVNQDLSPTIYWGVAGIDLKSNDTVDLQQLDTHAVLAGKQFPCIVMRRMDKNLLEWALEAIHDGDDLQPITEIAVRIARNIVENRVPLPAAEAAQKGSLPAIEEMLLRETPGWFLGRQEPELQEFIPPCRIVNGYFDWFLHLTETVAELPHRASFQHQSYTTGDVKFGNMMVDSDGNAGIIDPIFLPVHNAETATYMLAPWATSDWLQAVAFAMVEPIGYDMPETAAAIKAVAKEQSEKEGVEWTPWLELYLDILVGYKLMVETACAASNYVELVRNGKYDDHTMKKIEKYPQKTVLYLQEAITRYLQATNSRVG